MPITDHKCCPTCLESNLIDEIKISRCAQCSVLYCIHLASSIDPSKCTECLSDVTLIKETITKTYEHYNEEMDVVTVYKRRAKSIRLEGMDWLFAQRKILQMSNDSLELAIEYHRALLNGLLQEREARRIKHAHRYAGVALPKPSVQTDVTTSTTTTTKVKKSIKSTKENATANGVMQAMLAKGLTPQQMIEMLSKLQGTSNAVTTTK